MNKLMIISIFAIFMAAPALAQAQSSNAAVDPGFLPGNPMHSVETLVEKAEVRFAGIVGGPDLKAKAMANNAQERLAEANALADRNRSEDASEAVRKYEKTMNQSQEIADRRNNSKLSEQIKNVSRNNLDQLKQVRDKVPEQAREGIDRAIRNSERNGRPDFQRNEDSTAQRPETPGNNLRPNLTNKTPNMEDSKPDNLGKNLNGSSKNSELNDDIPENTSAPDKNNVEASESTDLEENLDDNRENSADNSPDDENLSDGFRSQLP